jgi:type IX secretion system PorP/SprF family membrane protein
MTICFCMLLLLRVAATGQDASFSQFFAVPATMNPATAGAYDENTRIMANCRQQWLDPAKPYYTGSLSYETKLARTRTDVADYRNDNILAVRVGFLHDNTFNGILKGSYAHLQLAYHQVLDADGEHRIGVGFGASYGRKYLDQSRLYFSSQFTSGGFNTSISSGEWNLSRMPGSFSLSSGINYTYSNSSGKATMEMGASAFHLNGPRETFLKDTAQSTPQRYTGHYSIDLSSGSGNSISLLAACHYQAGIGTLLAGIGYNKNISGGRSAYTSKFISAGALYRNRDAVIPNVSLFSNGMRIGLSYDVTVSRLLQTPGKPKTFELSFSWRMSKDEFDTDCPRVFSGFR